jgi:glutamyl-tRNA reductase
MADIKFLVMGVRSKTAGLDVREQFALDQSTIPNLLTDLVKNTPTLHEAVMVSTCNRSEIYVAMDDTEDAITALRQFWVQHRHVSLATVMAHTFVYLNQDAVAHLFNVTAGLDSLIVGESQIMAQVKDAWQLAQRAGTAPYFMDKLFNSALAVSKRVRTETGIEQKDTSVSHAAVQYWQHRQPQRCQQPIVVLGGGKVAEKLLTHLAPYWPNVTVVNRSPERLSQLLQQYPEVAGMGWQDLPQLLAKAGTVFVATGAPHVVMDAEDFAHVATTRIQPWVFDLSVPRNVCDSVGLVPGVTLVNLDELGVEQLNSLDRVSVVANQLVQEGVTTFEAWQRSIPTLSTLTRFRHKLEQLRQEQLSQVSAELQPVVDQFSRTLINKILHAPSIRLKHMQEAQPHLERLFDLDMP